MPMRFWLGAGLSFLLGGSAAAQAAPLFLVCNGINESQRPEQTSVELSNDRDASDSVSGTATTLRTQRAARTLQFELGEGVGRVRLPRAMIPLITTKKTDGWFPLTALSVDDARITGKFSLNALNRGSVRIDRRTGEVEVRALYSYFSGTCEKGSTAPEDRKF